MPLLVSGTTISKILTNRLTCGNRTAPLPISSVGRRTPDPSGILVSISSRPVAERAPGALTLRSPTRRAGDEATQGERLCVVLDISYWPHCSDASRRPLPVRRFRLVLTSAVTRRAPRNANGDTTPIPLMSARLMAITDHSGSMAVCSSVPVRGTTLAGAATIGEMAVGVTGTAVTGTAAAGLAAVAGVEGMV